MRQTLRFPTWHRKLAVSVDRLYQLHRINAVDLGLLKEESRRSIGSLLMEIGSSPVKHRHEIVADDFDADLAQFSIVRM